MIQEYITFMANSELRLKQIYLKYIINKYLYIRYAKYKPLLYYTKQYFTVNCLICRYSKIYNNNKIQVPILNTEINKIGNLSQGTK